MDTKRVCIKDIKERIISCAIQVHSTLSPGLLENVYIVFLLTY
ncbi:GxxExxY protein [candidate division KSB1 bacterium]